MFTKESVIIYWKVKALQTEPLVKQIMWFPPTRQKTSSHFTLNNPAIKIGFFFSEWGWRLLAYEIPSTRWPPKVTYRTEQRSVLWGFVPEKGTVGTEKESPQVNRKFGFSLLPVLWTLQTQIFTAGKKYMKERYCRLLGVTASMPPTILTLKNRKVISTHFLYIMVVEHWHPNALFHGILF